MNTVKMLNADCLAEMAAIPDRSFPLVLTDIPYGEVNRKSNGLRNLDKRDADTASFDVVELTRTLCGKTSGSVYMFCGINQLSTIRSTMTECGFSTRVIVWEKTNPSPMNGTKIWLSGIELCAFGKRQGGVYHGHCRNCVVRHPCGRHDLHPTQKPLALMEELIELSSNPGDMVFDPFMGSGTTGVAALRKGRGFFGIERSAEYFKVANDRVMKLAFA